MYKSCIQFTIVINVQYTSRRFNLFSCTILCAGVFFVIWDYVRDVYVKAFRSNNKFRDFGWQNLSTFDCCKFNLVWCLMRINVKRELKGHISFVSNTICETSSLCICIYLVYYPYLSKFFFCWGVISECILACMMSMMEILSFIIDMML